MSINPQDNGKITYELKYNRINKIVEIDQPAGFDSLEIEIEQDYVARDIVFKDLKLTFIRKPFIKGHDFNNLLNEFNDFGFETDINLMVNANGSLWFDGALDFKKAKTDGLTYIEVELDINNLSELIKEREDININLLGTETVGGEASSPAIKSITSIRPSILSLSLFYKLNDQNNNIVNDILLIRRLPYTASNIITLYPIFGVANIDFRLHNQFIPYVSNSHYGYDGDLSYDLGNSDVTFDTSLNSHLLLVGKDFYDKMYYHIKTDINGYSFDLTFKNLEITTRSNGLNLSKHNIHAFITTFSDNTYTTAVSGQSFYLAGAESFGSVSWFVSVEKNITVPQYSILTVVSSVRHAGNENLGIRIGPANSRIDFITEEDEGLLTSTQCEMIQIKEVGNKIIADVTDNTSTFSSDYLQNRYAGSYLTNGYYIREFSGYPINIKWKDYKDSLFAMFNMDVAINKNGVFAGNYRDFFADVEIKSFDVDISKIVEIEPDDDFQINGLTIKFEAFENDDKDSTIDSFLTESEWAFFNKKVGKTEKRDIKFIADGRSIENIRRDGNAVSPTKSKPEDEKIYIIDVYNDPVNGLVNRFDEGFTATGIIRTDAENNLRYSFKRLLYDNYLEYLNEVAFFNTNDLLKNTKFINNGNLETRADSTLDTVQEQIKDNANLSRIGSPIAKPIKYKFDLPVQLSWAEAVQLFDDIVNQRGYISFTFGSSTIKLYPCNGTKYILKEKRLEFVGKPKV